MNEDLVFPNVRGIRPVCAIGTSAGGGAALQILLETLPDDLGLSYIIAMHLAPDHTSVIHELLASHTSMPVLQVSQTTELQPDHVYIIAPNHEIVVEGDMILAPRVSGLSGLRTPIDRLFSSVGITRSDSLAVVMTGAGSDGSRGVLSIRESGGIVIVQDPSDAEYSTMPQSAIEAGAADFIEGLRNIGSRITELVDSKRAIQENEDASLNGVVDQILEIVQSRMQHDFSNYKRATILRRIKRRISLSRLSSVEEYVKLLESDPAESENLFSDLLISVTSFFRDNGAFEVLKVRCIQQMVEKAEGELRLWTVGCGSGEEAYSLAILLLEECGRLNISIPIQIFATDLNEAALASARKGYYARSIARDVSAERLRRFFIDEGTHYRVTREVRDIVLFATHSVVREPPFTRLDLLVCRNVLIYLERPLQQQVTSIFHYALKPRGYLFLGPAELPDMSSGMFDLVDANSRLYQTCVLPPPAVQTLPPVLTYPRFSTGPTTTSPLFRIETAALLEKAHVGGLETSAPPSVLIDDDYRVLHLSASAGRFIVLPSGPVIEHLPAMVRSELRGELLVALDRAFDQSAAVVSRAIDMTLDGAARTVFLHVAPVPFQQGSAHRAIVCFLEAGPIALEIEIGVAGPGRDEIHRLHERLRLAQEAVLTSRAEQDATVLELRAANERLQSLNEEYQSTTEELETSKEELQSINEELRTVNYELKNKIDLVSHAHNDLLNLTSSSEIGTLFLDRNLRIRMFTPPVTDLYNISATDVGRIVTDFTHRLTYHSLEADVNAVLRSLVSKEEEIQGPDGRSLLLRIRPYRTTDDKVAGAVVTFNDLTERKHATLTYEGLARYEAFETASSEVVFRMNADWSQMLRLTGRGFLSDTVEPSRSWMHTYIDPVDHENMQSAIDAAVRTKSIFKLEHRVRLADGSMGWTSSRAVPMLDQFGTVLEWIGTAIDVTKRRDLVSTLQTERDTLSTMVDKVPVMLWFMEPNGERTIDNYQWLNFTGQTHEETQNFGWSDVIHPEDRQSTIKAFRDACAKGEPLELTHRVRRAADGVYRLCLIRQIPAADSSGRIIHYYGSATDVHDYLNADRDQDT